MAAMADKIEAAIASTLASGLRTGDIMQPGMTQVGTTKMGQAIEAELAKSLS